MFITSQMVKSTLKQYKKDNQNVVAAIDVLRYAKMGFLKFTSQNLSEDMMAWYPRDMDYLMLRYAQMGQVKCNYTKFKKVPKNV